MWARHLPSPVSPHGGGSRGPEMPRRAVRKGSWAAVGGDGLRHSERRLGLAPGVRTNGIGTVCLSPPMEGKGGYLRTATRWNQPQDTHESLPLPLPGVKDQGTNKAYRQEDQVEFFDAGDVQTGRMTTPLSHAWR